MKWHFQAEIALVSTFFVERLPSLRNFDNKKLEIEMIKPAFVTSVNVSHVSRKPLRT